MLNTNVKNRRKRILSNQNNANNWQCNKINKQLSLPPTIPEVFRVKNFGQLLVSLPWKEIASHKPNMGSYTDVRSTRSHLFSRFSPVSFEAISQLVCYPKYQASSSYEDLLFFFLSYSITKTGIIPNFGLLIGKRINVMRKQPWPLWNCFHNILYIPIVITWLMRNRHLINHYKYVLS